MNILFTVNLRAGTSLSILSIFCQYFVYFIQEEENNRENRLILELKPELKFTIPGQTSKSNFRVNHYRHERYYLWGSGSINFWIYLVKKHFR